MKEIRIRRPDDFHVHFRRGEILKSVVPYTAQTFRRALVMPNTNPPILTAKDVKEYRSEIKNAAFPSIFEPLMTIKLTGSTTPAMVEDAKAEGIVAVKLYPEGVTTNSEDGVSLDYIGKVYPIFETMEKHDIVLSIHGEVPGEYVMNREVQFLPILENIANDFPKLRIVLEHITTAGAVILISNMRDGVAATITLHHLLITLDDILCDKGGGGESINPHHYCKPIAKSPYDRFTVRRATFSGNPKFFFGSDSAPHLREKKECDHGCAGVWNAPVALPLLLELFNHQSCLDCLQLFVSEFGAKFYGLPMNEGTITFVKHDPPVTVPTNIKGIVPFWAGKPLVWQQVAEKI